MQEGGRGGGLGSADALRRLNYLTWFYAYLDSAQIGCDIAFGGCVVVFLVCHGGVSVLSSDA